MARTPFDVGTRALLLALALALPSQAKTVLDALPTVRVDSGRDATARTVLSELERNKSRVTIVWLDGKYYWATREHREVVHLASGAAHYFIDPQGGGYVKVYDTHWWPASVRPPGQRWQLLEHVSLMMGTITYWGETAKFEPLEEALDEPLPQKR